MRCRQRDGINAELIRHLFSYDRETGILIWRVWAANRKMKPGSRAGYLDNCGTNTGYRRVQIGDHILPEAVVIWLYVMGEWPAEEIDHKNKVRDDNRWDNLRLATRSQQKMNSTIYRSNSSGHRGVAERKDRPGVWTASIRMNGKSKYLGYFKSQQDAINAYNKARNELFKEFA